MAIDISLEYLDEIIYKNVESSGKGFGGLTTEQGKYIYHPRNEYVTSGKTLLELAEEKKDSNRLTLHEKAKKHQGVILDHTSTTTGEESWLIAEPVQHSGWSVQNTFIKDDVLINTNILRHRLITALLCGVVSVLSVLLFLLTVMSFSPKKIWGLVAIASIVLSAAIGVVWRTALTYTEYQENGFAELKNQESANRYTRKYKELNLKIIPTGLYIESLKLIGDELTVSGHIWQKYPIQDQVPQNSFYIYPTRKISVEQVDIDNQGDYKIIISSFKADIPVTISYSKYPLEVEEIFFKILPRDSDKIFFVPDFSSGHFDAAVRLPALSENIVLAAWEITKTFFAFEKKNFRLNFGVPSYKSGDFDALSYRIAVKRLFLNAFLSNITPLIVVSIILFFVLLLPADTDISKVLGICSSLFLVVAFAHLGIRKSLATGELFYLEYFYFVIYLVILLTPIKKLLLSFEIKNCILTDQDGLFFKMIYWPFLLSLLLLVTVLNFF
ncbi:MAG: hypothetical protein D3910_11180 [Candidatus Electrothrix sp. ATG2]|nr:hypothetical protein [Candidatus Electrothrix sp. ATG2]